MNPVNPDDVSTWPARLLEVVQAIAVQVPPGTFGSDVTVPINDSQFVRLMDERPLLAYHATRLLPHELEDIRSRGLHSLSLQHVERRLEDAVGADVFSASEADRLRRNGVHLRHAPGERDGRVCAVVGLSSFSEDVNGIRPLLSTWGGEAIYWGASEVDRPKLSAVGTPSIVVVSLSLERARFFAFPQLIQVFVAHLARLEGHRGEIHYLSDVPRHAIQEIWQPGDSEYDRFSSLPHR
ncbi:hypothetical protein [Raineyella sp. W15-4]|uniref:hypothetical protein n=1 Tax=Raineyella sp. W15-4 TaxID=3081651 RepID=UPI0029545D72|nr:hypothetical protein [Raineyella sp. W15-4]WOQ17582.1 hypothetical protein R0145_02385 [Raineyella sp. W15-4]